MTMKKIRKYLAKDYIPTYEQVMGLFKFLYAFIESYPDYKNVPDFSFGQFKISRNLKIPDFLPKRAEQYFSGVRFEGNYMFFPSDDMKSLISNFKPYLSPVALLQKLEAANNKADTEPVRLNFLGFDDNLWMFKENCYYCDRSMPLSYTEDEIKLLILNEYDKERKHFESLQRKFSTSETLEESFHRPRIPEQIRIEVWRRDGGKCARCGSRENLEYDHIVPISKGGSNTARNIELLCEKCNRSKGANIE